MMGQDLSSLISLTFRCIQHVFRYANIHGKIQWVRKVFRLFVSLQALDKIRKCDFISQWCTHSTSSRFKKN